MPSYKCKHFVNKSCDIYETRTCLKADQLIERRAIPKSCPYAPKNNYNGRIPLTVEIEEEIFKTLPENTQKMLKEGFEYKKGM